MTTEARRYRDRISQDPQVMVGKPVVKGTRIPVELVLAQNPSLDELFTDYPRLTLEDVKACLDYASALVEHHPRATADTSYEAWFSETNRASW